MPALYLAFDHGTAVMEYEQDLGWRPGTLCAYRVRARVADLRDPVALAALGFEERQLRCPWKQLAFGRPSSSPPSWRLSDALIAQRLAGAIYPSMANPRGVNLVLWRWNQTSGARVEVLDPLGDLPRSQASWE